MASHIVIKPVRHAGVASQDTIFIAGGTIPEGAPVVFSSGKVVEATDGNDGPTSGIVGICLGATVLNADCMVALALPGRRFVASFGDNTAASQSDAGSHALALADIGSVVGLHKDATTLKWIVATEASGAGRVTALVDKVGATTIDTRSFGESGSSTGVTPATTTPPFQTFTQNPPSGPDFGTARVEFIFKIADTIYG